MADRVPAVRVSGVRDASGNHVIIHGYHIDPNYRTLRAAIVVPVTELDRLILDLQEEKAKLE